MRNRLGQGWIQVRLDRRAVVVDDVAVGTFDVLEEGQELGVAVPWLARGGHLAGGDPQRGEQGGGAVPDVVVGAALDQPGLHRQHRHDPVQGLDLGLLVHAEHDRVLRGIQYGPTMSTILASNSRSVENRKDRLRHGLIP